MLDNSKAMQQAIFASLDPDLLCINDTLDKVHFLSQVALIDEVAVHFDFLMRIV